MVKIIDIILLSTLFIPAVAWSLPQDKHQMLTLQSDKADLNHTQHRGIYQGHVELDQGTSHLRAAKAITEGNAQNKLIRAIAEGDKSAQAHFWTQTASDKPTLHAYADKIYYYPERHLIELVGQACITQGEHRFSAAKIAYDIKRQHVLTQSGENMRTTITLYPDKPL